MRIGILTFHSQLNYGGVLQCWALQTALEKMGHEVAVIDRWFDDDRNIHDTAYDRMGWRQWVKFWIRSLCGLGWVAPWLRVRRTRNFLGKCLNLTPYHFIEWKDAPQDLGIDAIVVGSDQVWHCGDWGDPRVYLLEDAPSILAIAYAASFGMTAIPQFIFDSRKELEAKPVYKRGLARFKAVSCRESEGVRFCEGFGIRAEHVVDPTLLLHGEDWKPLVGSTCGEGAKKLCLVCYFLSENVDEAVSVLEAFAKQAKCIVKVFVDHRQAALLPFPTSYAKFKVWVKGIWKRLFGRVSICVSAGPKEFVKAFSDATWVVSDSFHALMFATVFKKNVRILRPKTESRCKMFARIEEFAAHTDGRLIVDSLAGALKSFARGENVELDYDWIGSRRRESEAWLSGNLK